MSAFSMSLIKECDENIGVNDDVLTRELFDSTSTSSSNGSTTTSRTGGYSASSSSSLQERHSSTALSPLAALPYAADSCKLSPLSTKLIPSTNSKPSSSCPASALRYPRKLEHDHNGAVKRSMGLMKLRRQGSHPPATPNNYNTCNGTFNQAAAARELMASLERLSMKEKTMDTDEEREKEAQRALLRSGSEESINASRRNGMKAELPLTAKIAAAMDAEGLIGVQEEISEQYSKYKSRVLAHSVSPPSSFKSTCKTRKQFKRPAVAGSISGDHEMRPRKMQSTLSRRRSRWIILRKLRSSRALLGRIWRKFKRVFASSSRKHLQIKELLKVNTFKD